jgi:hypothetical protein
MRDVYSQKRIGREKFVLYCYAPNTKDCPKTVYDVDTYIRIRRGARFQADLSEYGFPRSIVYARFSFGVIQHALDFLTGHPGAAIHLSKSQYDLMPGALQKHLHEIDMKGIRNVMHRNTFLLTRLNSDLPDSVIAARTAIAAAIREIAMPKLGMAKTTGKPTKRRGRIAP